MVSISFMPQRVVCGAVNGIWIINGQVCAARLAPGKAYVGIPDIATEFAWAAPHWV